MNMFIWEKWLVSTQVNLISTGKLEFKRIKTNTHAPTHSEQALFDGVSLGFGEAAALGQAVHSVEERVDERGKRLCARE